MNARRTVVRLTFAGVDISADINKHLLSLTYTDNEEDKTDDLQLSLDDREGVWLGNWLNTPGASKGVEISAVIVQKNWESNGKDRVLDCGVFEIDTVDGSGPPAVARQFFCETRTEFSRKNSPFLRTKSETRSLASKATKTYRLLMQSSGEFNTPGGAVNPLLPLLFLPLLHAILGALFLGRQILGNRDDIHFRELLDVTLSVFHENGVDRDHILLNFHLFCPPSSFATLFSRAAFCSARLAISS